MQFWMSIEIFNGPFAARLWADSHADSLIETAVTSGAVDWQLTRTAWGVAFEVAFTSEAEWNRYRATDAVTNALKNVPDPKHGILIYRGRSLDGGTPSPRKPKPKSGSGSAALALPYDPIPRIEPLPAFFSDMLSDKRLVSTN